MPKMVAGSYLVQRQTQKSSHLTQKGGDATGVRICESSHVVSDFHISRLPDYHVANCPNMFYLYLVLPSALVANLAVNLIVSLVVSLVGNLVVKCIVNLIVNFLGKR